MPDKPQPGDSPLLPPLPAPPSPRFAKPAPRTTSSKYESLCNHGRLTRIWDPERRFRCCVCKKPTGNFGWIWRCTQDTNGYLPESDFINQPNEKIVTTMIPSKDKLDDTVAGLDPAVRAFLDEGDYTIEQLNTVPMLAQWILKASGKRDYTHEQVKKFIRQKIDVQIAIRKDLAGARPATASSGTGGTRPTTAASTAQESGTLDTSVLT